MGLAAKATERRTSLRARAPWPLLLGLLALAASAAPALARPSTQAMTCAAAAGLVKRSGGVVLDTSPTTFDRFVSDMRFCQPDEALRPAFERTRDNPQCFIGYTCYEPDRGHRDW